LPYCAIQSSPYSLIGLARGHGKQGAIVDTDSSVYSSHSRVVPPSGDVPGGRRSGAMDTLTLLIIIIVVVLLLGGGGFWYRGRR